MLLLLRATTAATSAVESVGAVKPLSKSTKDVLASLTVNAWQLFRLADKLGTAALGLTLYRLRPALCTARIQLWYCTIALQRI
jgi:hypothetical protein